MPCRLPSEGGWQSHHVFGTGAWHSLFYSVPLSKVNSIFVQLCGLSPIHVAAQEPGRNT